MAYLEYPDRVESVLLANDPDDMLDMYGAARRIDGTSIEILPNQTDEDRHASAGECLDFAVDFNSQSGSDILDPRIHFELAKEKMTAGGFVVRLTAYPDAERTAQANVSLFSDTLGGIRRAARIAEPETVTD